MRRLLAPLSALLLLCACQSLPKGFEDAVPVSSQRERASLLANLEQAQRAAAGRTWRYEAELEVASSGESHAISAAALWLPGQKVRYRLRYLGHTFFSALCTGEEWLLFLEDKGTVYVCPRERLETLRSPEVPDLAWTVLGRSLRGFLPLPEACEAYRGGNSLIFTTGQDNGRETLRYDPAEPLLPRQGLWESPSGETCAGTFKNLRELDSPRAFEPGTNAYKVVRL